MSDLLFVLIAYIVKVILKKVKSEGVTIRRKNARSGSEGNGGSITELSNRLWETNSEIVSAQSGWER